MKSNKKAKFPIEKVFEKPNLQREEVRGLFVLGIIATLLAAKDVLNFSLKIGTATITISTVVNYFVLYWGMYALLMSVAVSDDTYNETTIRLCNFLARFLFKGGIFILAVSLFSIGFIYGLVTLFPSLGSSVAISIMLVIIVFLGALLFNKMERKGSKL